MNAVKKWIVWTLLAAAPAGSAADSFIANGDFQRTAAEGQLESWTQGTEGSITRPDEGGKPFLRLTAGEPNQLVEVKQAVPLPAGVQAVEFAARFRTANVKFGKNFLCDARARFGFYDAAGQRVGKGPGDVIFTSHAKDWTDIRRKFLVPEGAATLNVQLCLNRPASGTLDVENVALTALPPEEAEAMAMAPLLAERKKAEDEAETQKMIGMPSVTEELRGSGNSLLTAEGRKVILRGVNVPSLEWSARGEEVRRGTKVAIIDWKANAIRLPVHNGFWFGRGKGGKEPNDAEAYRQTVDEVIKIAASQGAHVILDLHLYGAPKAEAAEFWKDAAARYANNPAVLFDLYNEPNGIDWDLWRNGGPFEAKKKGQAESEIISVVGMQQLVEVVRSTGAKNLIIAGGLSHAYNLGGILEGYALEDPAGNGIMYATHFYNWHRGWEKNFLKVAEKYPVLVGEFGADVKKMSFVPAKNQEDPFTWVPDALGMIQEKELHYTGFSLHPKATPVLIKDWTYEPTPFWGAFLKDALSGKKFESKALR